VLAVPFLPASYLAARERPLRWHADKKNFAVFSVLDWIATLTTNIPNKEEQLVAAKATTATCREGKEKREARRED
jgi:hypothetical protein